MNCFDFIYYDILLTPPHRVIGVRKDLLCRKDLLNHMEEG